MRFLTLSYDVTRINSYCQDCTPSRHSMMLCDVTFRIAHKSTSPMSIFSKRVLFISLPVLIECGETCIHVTVLFRVVLIKPIFYRRHIATATILFFHPRFSTSPQYRVFYLSESPDQHISAANTKQITTLLNVYS